MADSLTATPQLIKKLVGETFTFEVTLNPDFGYKVELFTNINRNSDVFPMDLVASGKFSCHIPLTQSGFFHWKVRYQREGTKTWRWLKDSQGLRFEGMLQVDPVWLNKAVAYNVFVRFFNGAVQRATEISPGEGGTFDDVKAHLDELAAMGINLLYFNPIHLIGELYRKYDTFNELPDYWQPGSPYSIKDYKSIDPELTYDKDTKKHLLSDPQKEFFDLVKAAHDKGMFVIMDLVFNHTAHDFIFQRIRPEWYLYKESITSLEDPYLYPEDRKKGKPWGDAKHTMAPYDHGLWFDDVAQLNWEYMLPDASNKPPKNPGMKEMWEYFKSIPRYWIRHFGIDGFRCDIAYRVPSEFWKACIAEARSEAQTSHLSLSHDAVFIAEAYTDNLYELQQAGFSAVYGDISNKMRTPSDLLGYVGYMLNLESTHFPEGSKWFVFPESHDFARTPEKILGDEMGNEALSLLANKTRWFITATVPGIPLVFNGFEKVELKPVNLFGYGAVDWSKQSDLRDFIAIVNGFRRDLPALELTAEFVPVQVYEGDNLSNSVLGYIRRNGEQSLLVILNMDVKEGHEVTTILPDSYGVMIGLDDLLSDVRIMVSDRQFGKKFEPAEMHLFLIKHYR